MSKIIKCKNRYFFRGGREFTEGCPISAIGNQPLYTVAQHVGSSSNTPWISISTDFKIAFNYTLRGEIGSTGYLYVIDSNKLEAFRAYDYKYDDTAMGKFNKNKTTLWREWLVWREIPRSAIVYVYKILLDKKIKSDYSGNLYDEHFDILKKNMMAEGIDVTEMVSCTKDDEYFMNR